MWLDIISSRQLIDEKKGSRGRGSSGPILQLAHVSSVSIFEIRPFTTTKRRKKKLQGEKAFWIVPRPLPRLPRSLFSDSLLPNSLIASSRHPVALGYYILPWGLKGESTSRGSFGPRFKKTIFNVTIEWLVVKQ